MPIVKRRFGRKGSDIHHASTSHVIKCGWKATSKNSGKEYPTKLPGLLLCKEAVGGDGRNLIDWDAMERLGCRRDAIEHAISRGEKADAGSLPTEMVVRVAHNAKWVDAEDGGYWTFPGTFDESYQCWRKEGLFCSGDGHRAMRLQKDGTKAPIPCVPIGSSDADPETYCPFSVSGECKPKGALILRPCIYREPSPSERQKGVPSWQLVEPLLPVGGLARLVTGSDYSLMGIKEVLGEAADRLRGRTAGLSGVLSVSLRRRRTRDGPVNVPAISLAFNEEELIGRERLWLEIDAQRQSVEAIEWRGNSADTLALPDPVEAESDPEHIDAPHPSDDELATDDQPIEAEYEEPIEADEVDDDDDVLASLIATATRLEEEKANDDAWFGMGAREIVEAASEFKRGHRVMQASDFMAHRGKDAKKHAISMTWMRKTLDRLHSGKWAPHENWESMFGGEA